MAPFNKYVSSPTADSQVESEDEELVRILNTITLYKKSKSDVEKSYKRANVGKTSDKEFNKLHKTLKEEQRKSRGRKRRVVITDFKPSPKTFKEKEIYLANCSGCDRCATLNHKEKVFYTELICKLFKKKNK